MLMNDNKKYKKSFKINMKYFIMYNLIVEYACYNILFYFLISLLNKRPQCILIKSLKTIRITP